MLRPQNLLYEKKLSQHLFKGIDEYNASLQ